MDGASTAAGPAIPMASGVSTSASTAGEQPQQDGDGMLRVVVEGCCHGELDQVRRPARTRGRLLLRCAQPCTNTNTKTHTRHARAREHRSTRRSGG